MEQSSSRLYTGPLSQAALKVLAVLRAQNLDETRGNQHASSYQRQMGRCNYSHVESLPPSSWNAVERKDSYSYWQQVSFSTSDELQSSQTSTSHQIPDSSPSSQPSSCWEFSLQQKTPQTAAYYSCFQTSSNRICSESSAYLSSPAREVPDTQVPSCCQDRYSSSLQIPERHAENQTTPCRISPGRVGPSFIAYKFPDEEGPDEAFETPTEEPNSHSVACHTPSFSPEICEETVNTSGAPNEDKTIWNIDRNEPEDTSGSKLKSEPSEETTNGVKDGEILYEQSESISQPPCDFVTKDNDSTVAGTAERDQTEGLVVQSEFLLEHNRGPNLEKVCLMAVTVEDDTESKVMADDEENTECMMDTEQLHCSEVQQNDRQCETNFKEGAGLSIINTAGQRGEDREVLEVPHLGGEEKIKSAENSDGKQCPLPRLSQEGGARRSGFKPPCLLGNQEHLAKSTNESSRGSKSSIILIPASKLASGLNSSSPQNLVSLLGVLNKKLETKSLPSSQSQLHHPPLIPSFPQKRKHDVFQHQHANSPPKIYQTRCPPKWQPPRILQEKTPEKGVSEMKKARPEKQSLIRESLNISACVRSDPDALKLTQQSWEFKSKEPSIETAKKASKQTSLSKPCKDKWAKCWSDFSTDGPKCFHDGTNTSDQQNQSKTGSHPTTLTSDSRVKDSGQLNPEEKLQVLEETGRAKVVLLTMVFRDGTTQLDPEQNLAPAVCGLLVLMKNDLSCNTPENTLGLKDSLVYLKLEHTPLWAQQHIHHTQELFTRDVLLRVLSRSQLVVCYKAKGLLRTALQHYREDLSWKQVAGCQLQDPQVSGWLLDPTDPSSCYNDLLYKHCQKTSTASTPGAQRVSQIISSLNWLYKLNMNLCTKLQSQGLWELYSEMELRMIPVLAVMESHYIHVDKDALKRTSDLLGAKMKQLEQEAHRAAGQIFLLTSNTQLRTILFEKLHLHERCENKKLPKTISKQQQSTSEAALLQLQDLHPLPKIILEYRQIHKIKSTFVDGILSCMKSKNYISSTWYQTSVVTGRISAKHPNFQALPRQPLQISKAQYIQGKEKEVVAVHPRAMFIPQEGWTFLAADFCQVELRLLAHFSSDPELLRIFTNPQADVFTMLASQWKGMSVDVVTSEDREHAKRIVYSVVYGAGRERLSGILGVSAEQASQFQNSFLQTYREVQTFIQRTIQQSHKQGYVLSVMGRRRNLPNINSPDWAVRMQAERQAVNFVVQGSAADLCKMAMITIFNLVSSSGSLSPRLLAQLHDELLYEVEDSQVEQFAALVRSIMESLQHIDHLGVHLKVPLKVAVSCGKSWGSMSELHFPPLPSSSP